METKKRGSSGKKEEKGKLNVRERIQEKKREEEKG